MLVLFTAHTPAPLTKGLGASCADLSRFHLERNKQHPGEHENRKAL